MSSRARTNQLLYQAELLAESPGGDDEHAAARRMAIEEGALALFELALEAFLAEVTEHARLDTRRWQVLLATDGPPLAELKRLGDLARDPDSWLGWLVGKLVMLHGDDGVARRRSSNPAMIALDGEPPLGDELRHRLRQAKQDMAALRETSLEW
ncbi:DUF6586 family protein [Vreelandella malpeensis]|uniref:Uncharacterized protein n=1 Tax=Vreelandella malpeensis TaxID=1172368 RepID=A0ABS8DVD5_9GAMM|nr:hypothetical protein [Halomonas malpeensis]